MVVVRFPILNFIPSLLVYVHNAKAITMAGKEERVLVSLSGGCPWGFRLQGGAGTGLPLIVSKVSAIIFINHIFNILYQACLRRPFS